MLVHARIRVAAPLLAAGLLLTACSGSGDPDAGATDTSDATEATPTDTSDDTAGDVDTGSEAPQADGEDGQDAATAAVLTATATAPDGSTFTIGDYAGQPVLVETFATWCSTCRQQLGATQAAAVEAGDDVVFLILSVETTIDPAQLATYAEEHGFTDLRFGVLEEQGLADFAEVFGRSVLNPPSTPKFRVTPDGEVSELTTGMESAEEILATLGAA